MRHVFLFVGLTLLTAGSAAAADIKSPEEQYKSMPNNLAQIPPGWATTKPIHLEVAFNLKYPVNSPEADAFLKTWYRSIKALPDKVALRMERVVLPAKFAYVASLTFPNWQAFRTYEQSAGFLGYYREQWKPVVTEAQEQVSIPDDDVSR